MKQVIDGKLYDTETAEEIYNHDNGHSRTDFKWFDETLYRTGKGAWFLRGVGGPDSLYARQIENGRQGSDGLYAYTEAEAKAWLEQYAPAETFLKYFQAEEA